MKYFSKFKGDFKLNFPMSKLGNVEYIANAVNFLISDNASYITGENLHVNGGLYMP